jgi:hypothetical protein
MRPALLVTGVVACRPMIDQLASLAAPNPAASKLRIEAIEQFTIHLAIGNSPVTGRKYLSMQPR